MGKCHVTEHSSARLTTNINQAESSPTDVVLSEQPGDTQFWLITIIEIWVNVIWQNYIKSFKMRI